LVLVKKKKKNKKTLARERPWGARTRELSRERVNPTFRLCLPIYK